MLNVNARSFVPPTQPLETGPYRYELRLPAQRTVNTVEEIGRLNNLSSFLLSKQLFADKGMRDEDSLNYFLGNCIQTIFSEGMNYEDVAGFLISKEMLSLKESGALMLMNDASGFLVHVDLPEDNLEVVYCLHRFWASFYQSMSPHDFVKCTGYTRSLIGDKETGSYRHYFFGCCDSDEAVSGLLVSGELRNIQMAFHSIFKINSILPYACGPLCPLTIIISVGESAKSKMETHPFDFSTTIKYSSSNIEQNFKEVRKFEEDLSKSLSGSVKWARSFLFHVNLQTEKNCAGSYPVWDMIYDIGLICDNTGSCVIGVSFSEPDSASGIKKLLASNPTNPFYINADVETILASGQVLNVSNTCFGSVPQKLRKPVIGVTQLAAIETIALSQGDSVPSDILLNRKNFADAAAFFSHGKYAIRRKVSGVRVIIGTDCNGDTFGFDKDTNSVFGLPNNFGGVSPKDTPKDCIFIGTITSSYWGINERRAIIEDVLFFQGNDMRSLPFAERWRSVESVGIDEDDLWPHPTTDHFVILRAKYISSESVTPSELTNLNSLFPCSDYSSLGLVFVPNVYGDKKSFTYYWTPPSSVSAFFAVTNISTGENPDIKRVYLNARTDENSLECAPYENEYTEFFSSAFPSIKDNDVIECVVRRGENTHWWDAVRVFESGTKNVSLHSDVDEIVFSPVASEKEVIWLLGSSSYFCGRCGKLNESGMVNELQGKDVFWCTDCWKETGHGDCIHCGRTCALGMFDGSSGLFYCKNCWDSFSAVNQNAEIGYHVPPPPDATFTRQVITRCVSLLVDAISLKWATNDVLDLCCGGSVVRKWMKNGTMRYLGVDCNPEAVKKIENLIKNPATKELSGDMRYNVICEDAFSPDLMQKITEIHPRQFHVISCFSAFHRAFASEEIVRTFIGSVANALVPGGLFVGFFVDANVAFSNGTEFSNTVFSTQWDKDAKPRFGNTFKLSIEGGPFHSINVVSVDYLIDVAVNFNLSIVPEACQTLLDFIEKDKNFTKVLNDDEREYLCVLRSFVFRKNSEEKVAK